MKNNTGSTKLTTSSSTKLTTSGFAPIIIIIAVVLVSGATYALVPHSVLKSFFEKGDKPTQGQFSDTIDSTFETGDVPQQNDFADTIDSGLNLQDDHDLLGLKEYNPTKDYQAGDTVVYNQTIYSQTQGVPPKRGCVSNLSPAFTHHITDLSKVSSIVPPPTMGAGPNLKTHSYINSESARVPVYAPADMTIKAGSYYESGPYMFDFWASCEVTVRFGHMTEPVDALKKLLPTEPKPSSDSRTQGLSGVSFKAGELIGYTTGTSLAGNWDFGVYNSSVKNRYADDPDWGWSDINTTAVCPFNYFTSELKEEYRAKLNSQALSGNPPHGDSFCK